MVFLPRGAEEGERNRTGLCALICRSGGQDFVGGETYARRTVGGTAGTLKFKGLKKFRDGSFVDNV